MSINVEQIGNGLVIHQYRFEVASKHYCKMVSISEVISPAGWTTTQVIWELRSVNPRNRRAGSVRICSAPSRWSR